LETTIVCPSRPLDLLLEIVEVDPLSQYSFSVATMSFKIIKWPGIEADLFFIISYRCPLGCSERMEIRFKMNIVGLGCNSRVRALV
jgi:hypothetical protein